jgi:hypothetical protein
MNFYAIRFFATAFVIVSSIISAIATRLVRFLLSGIRPLQALAIDHTEVELPRRQA